MLKELQQLSAAITRDTIPAHSTANYSEGFRWHMIERCRECQNVDGHSFPDE